MPFNREMLSEQMKDKCPMYLMEIVKCSNTGAIDKIHAEAEPFLARALTNLTKQMLLADDVQADAPRRQQGGGSGQCELDHRRALPRVTWRGGIGFTVISPTMIKEGMAHTCQLTYANAAPDKASVLPACRTRAWPRGFNTFTLQPRLRLCPRRAQISPA